MARFYRRRKRQLLWMPNLGTEPAGGGFDLTDFPAVRKFELEATGYSTDNDYLDLTWDQPTEDVITSVGGGIPSLSDWENSAWRLKRIVGKLFVACTVPTDTQQNASNGIVTAGFIVLKVNPDGTPHNPPVFYDPTTLANIRDPWIWRRTWVLSPEENQGFGVGAVTGRSGFPITNMDYGSVLDGPHVDIKCNRIIRAEERLFLCISVRIYDFDVPGMTTSSFRALGMLDYRLLGTTMKASNRRNASR